MSKNKDSNDSEIKRLYRSKRNRMIAGICSGLGDYLQVDPTFVRLLWFLSFFAGGLGVLVYIAGMIIIPEGENGEGVAVKYTFPTEGLGLLLIFFGAVFFIAGILITLNIFDFLSWIFFRSWPILLIAFGVLLITIGVVKVR